LKIGLNSQVLISNDREKTLSIIQASVTKERIVTIFEEEKAFSVAEAKLAIEKAYMASEETTLIVLAAKAFSPVVQNKLLKVIEEPPPKTEFILITASKASILPTIRSRLPIKTLSEEVEEEELALDLLHLTLESAYSFIQTHKRTDAKQMKPIVERICKAAIFSGSYTLDEKSLILFAHAYVALDIGSPPSFVLTTLLLKLLARKKR